MLNPSALCTNFSPSVSTDSNIRPALSWLNQQIKGGNRDRLALATNSPYQNQDYQRSHAKAIHQPPHYNLSKRKFQQVIACDYRGAKNIVFILPISTIAFDDAHKLSVPGSRSPDQDSHFGKIGLKAENIGSQLFERQAQNDVRLSRLGDPEKDG
jgi:hypothetical protein